MISKVSIHNFKCLRDVNIDLERFTVFVGPNASGKSSILQGLDILCRAFISPADLEVESTLIHGMSRGSPGPVELRFQAGDGWYRYRTGRTQGSPKPVHPSHWKGEGAALANKNDPEVWSPCQKPPKQMPASVLLQLQASELVKHEPASDPTVMTPQGTGLHSALANIALSDPESWQSLQDRLHQIVPTLRRLRHTMKTGRGNAPALLFDMIGADSLPANQVSEGTLLVLGLLAALHAPNRPNLVLLDDLDRGLHPKAQKELIGLLRGLLEATPDLQIVATTHSPYMLDCMQVNEVRMTFLNDEGATQCAALTSHPNFPKWKDEMTPGEMWSLFGEKWILEEVLA